MHASPAISPTSPAAVCHFLLPLSVSHTASVSCSLTVPHRLSSLTVPRTIELLVHSLGKEGPDTLMCNKEGWSILHVRDQPHPRRPRTLDPHPNRDRTRVTLPRVAMPHITQQ